MGSQSWGMVSSRLWSYEPPLLPPVRSSQRSNSQFWCPSESLRRFQKSQMPWSPCPRVLTYLPCGGAWVAIFLKFYLSDSNEWPKLRAWKDTGYSRTEVLSFDRWGFWSSRLEPPKWRHVWTTCCWAWGTDSPTRLHTRITQGVVKIMMPPPGIMT